MEKKIVDFWYMANRNLFLYWLHWCSLKRKCYYCDKIFITSWTGCCHCTTFHAVSGKNFYQNGISFQCWGDFSTAKSWCWMFFSKIFAKTPNRYLVRDKLSVFVISYFNWGRVTHICISKLTIIGSSNGLWPGWHQAIIWTNDGKLLNKPLGTNFNEILIEIYTFSFRKMHLKMSSAKWHPFCLGLNVLIYVLPWHCYDLPHEWLCLQKYTLAHQVEIS